MVQRLFSARSGTTTPILIEAELLVFALTSVGMAIIPNIPSKKIRLVNVLNRTF